MKLARASQLLRRALQLGVLVFIAYSALGGPWRNYKVAHNHRRLVTLIEGETWGTLYGLNEDALARWKTDSYEASKDFLGMPWASRAFGVDGADPIMVAAHATTTGGTTGELLLGLALPVLLALLLGKVFCSHLCPQRLMFELGQMVRRGLVRLGVPLPALRSDARFGGWVLLGGLLGTALAGAGVWFFVLPYLALSTSLLVYASTGVALSLVAVSAIWVLVDALVAPGYFCHNLCPTGFVLEQLGRVSMLKLRKRDATPCPDRCNLCELSCPYGLLPKHRTHTPACDNCGRCVPACPQTRLARRFRLPVVGAVLGVLVVVLFPTRVHAHHNKGLPHYGYYENYPQVPTDEYVTVQGKWELGATIFNFQGLERSDANTPNDVKIYCYLYDLEADYAYMGPVDFEIRQGDAIVSRFVRDSVDEEAVYSTRETMPASGDYQLVAVIGGEQAAVLDFYIELAGDGPSWVAIAGISAPVMLLFGLAYAGRSRKRRRAASPSRRRSAASKASTAALLALTVLASAHGAASAQPAPAPANAHVETEGEASGEVCPDCGMIDCTMDHYQTADGGQVMVMGGIPLWLFLAGFAAIILLSFVGTEVLGSRTGAGFRFDLIGNRRVYLLMRNRWVQTVPQLAMAGILGLLICVGLFGSRVANITPVAVWTLWWGGLIFLVLVLASAWCFACPWDGLANLFSRLRLAARVEPLSLNLRFPGWLRNVYPAIALFVLLTWLELGFGVTTNPRWTAYMGLGMAAAAIAFALLFDGKKFCAHACPVGRICGIYSTFAPIEIRARKPRTCQSCRTEDCLNGNERGYPCPTGLSLKTIGSSSQCTMCTECIKSCNKHNVAINLRPLGADLRALKSPRLDEAWLAVILLTLTLFHGLTMTPAWESFAPGAPSLLKWVGLTFGTSRVVSFTLAMVVVCALPVLLYWLSCRAAAALAGHRQPAGLLFRNFAYSLLPVALFYHLAHNLMHLAMEGGHIVPMLSDPMGNGSDYLGTAGTRVGHLLPESTMWYLQVGLILVGHVFGIVVAHRVAHRMYGAEAGGRRAAIRSLVPMLILMIAISVGGLYLMHLDMNMRVGRM